MLYRRVVCRGLFFTIIRCTWTFIQSLRVNSRFLTFSVWVFFYLVRAFMGLSSVLKCLTRFIFKGNVLRVDICQFVTINFRNGLLRFNSERSRFVYRPMRRGCWCRTSCRYRPCVVEIYFRISRRASVVKGN